MPHYRKSHTRLSIAGKLLNGVLGTMGTEVTDRYASYLLGQRFSACFVLKFALQRGEGEKREEVQISN